ncbi:MAG TPA: OsmC family peroxiredoxin [Ktedonobacterales bacterium]|nr:OsmC family peroxiredoxin [Ktedonobacterales bacterium]
MAIAERKAEVIWEGNLQQGKGNITPGSGAFATLPVTWASRTEAPDGRTSPEELIASAHAACYAMAFSNTLNSNGTPPERLNVTAVCALDRIDGKLKITTMRLDVHGKVPGLDQAGFAAAAQTAEQGCPVSNALRNNVEITVNATLD